MRAGEATKLPGGCGFLVGILKVPVIPTEAEGSLFAVVATCAHRARRDTRFAWATAQNNVAQVPPDRLPIGMT